MSESFFNEDFLPLEKSGQLELVHGDKEITNSVKVKMTGGPSKGHQVVFVNLGSEKLVFAGDLIPTPYHLQPQCISAVDEFPNDTLIQKKELLDIQAKMQKGINVRENSVFFSVCKDVYLTPQPNQIEKHYHSFSIPEKK